MCRVQRKCVTRSAIPGESGEAPTSERELGVVVCRGTAVTLVCPRDGMEEIANPFADVEEA